MSFNEADMYSGFSVGYDEYPYSGVGDEESILSNRAYKTGEIRDSLYPLMNQEYQSKYVGSGPLLVGPPTIGDMVVEQKNKLDKRELQEQLSTKTKERLEPVTYPELMFGITMLHVYIFIVIILAYIAYMQYTQYSQMREFISVIRSIGLYSMMSGTKKE
jgi:hypothetical protein